MSAPVPFVVVSGGNAYSAGEVEVEVFDMDNAQDFDLEDTIALLERMVMAGMSESLRGFAVEIVQHLQHELTQQRPPALEERDIVSSFEDWADSNIPEVSPEGARRWGRHVAAWVAASQLRVEGGL